MRALWTQVRWFVFFGWVVAAIRLGMEFTIQPRRGDVAWWFGVYALMPLAFLVAGLRGSLDQVSWKRIALMALAIAVLVWGVPNLVTYTIGQFQGWTHGRFAPRERSADIGATPLAKIGWAAFVSVGTVVIGGLVTLVEMTLLIWLPGWFRRRKRRPGLS